MNHSIYKLWTLKNEYNVKAWNCEKGNKGIAKFVYSRVDFVVATFCPSYYAFHIILFIYFLSNSHVYQFLWLKNNNSHMLFIRVGFEIPNLIFYSIPFSISSRWFFVGKTCKIKIFIHNVVFTIANPHCLN